MARSFTRGLQAQTMLRAYPYSVGNGASYGEVGFWHGSGFLGDGEPAAGTAAAAPGGATGPTTASGTGDWVSSLITGATQVASTAISTVGQATGMDPKTQAKLAKKIAKLRARAAKVKNPQRRAALIAQADALALALNSGAPPAQVAAQADSIDAQIAQAGVPDTSPAEYAVGALAVAALLGGGYYLWKKKGR